MSARGCKGNPLANGSRNAIADKTKCCRAQLTCESFKAKPVHFMGLGKLECSKNESSSPLTLKSGI